MLKLLRVGRPLFSRVSLLICVKRLKTDKFHKQAWNTTQMNITLEIAGKKGETEQAAHISWTLVECVQLKCRFQPAQGCSGLSKLLPSVF